jgi:hypothetical protein
VEGLPNDIFFQALLSRNMETMDLLEMLAEIVCSGAVLGLRLAGSVMTAVSHSDLLMNADQVPLEVICS